MMSASANPHTSTSLELWLATLDAELPQPQWLSREELRHAEQFATELASRRYRRSRGTLRAILASYLNCHPCAVNVGLEESGKPVLAGEQHGALNFNLSHSGRFAIYAICPSVPVGVDIQLDDSHIDAAALIKTIASPSELWEYSCQPESRRREFFFRLWTRKEAYVKCLGNGLVAEPNCVQVPTADEVEVCWTVDGRWCSTRSFRVCADYHVSLTALTAHFEIKSFLHWPSHCPVSSLNDGTLEKRIGSLGLQFSQQEYARDCDVDLQNLHRAPKHL